ATPPPAPLRKTGFVDWINMMVHARRYFKIVARRWILLVVCVVGGLGGGFYKASRVHDMYRASSKISLAPRVQAPTDNSAKYYELLDGWYERQLNDYLKGSVVQKRVDDAMKKVPIPPDPFFEVAPVAVRRGSSFVLTVDSTDFDY